jgi:acetyltransferase-like isoleucine patch superfamily enzyme
VRDRVERAGRRALQRALDRLEARQRDALEIRSGDPMADRFAAFGPNSRIEWPRVDLVNPASVAVGADTYIRRHLCIEAFAKPGDVIISFGDRVQVGYYCRFVAVNGIEIRDDAGIGHGSTITDTVHVFKDDEHASSGWKAPLRLGDPLIVGEGAWVGNNCVVTGGITIGERAITSANTVINRNVPPETVIGGNPARVFRHKRGGRWEWLIDPNDLDLETMVAVEERQG